MAAKHTTYIVASICVMITLFCSCTVTSAQAPTGSVAFGPAAEAPMPDCMTNLLNLSDCLTYVEAGSNLTKPDKPCCPELAGLVESSPQCLCKLLDKNATSSYGIDIDMDRALKLPSVCHVSTPPVSLCSVINGAPVGVPTQNTDEPISPTAEPPGTVASGPTAEAPMPDCVTNLLNMSDCLTFVEAGSNLTKPDKACCPELAGLVESSPQCLCMLLDKNATASYGISIDMDRALKLPSICHVETPPVSLCSVINGGGGPVGAPTPTTGGVLPPEGSAAPGPSTTGNVNGASSIAVSGLASLIVFLPMLFGI